jgi:hypothetical protein
MASSLQPRGVFEELRTHIDDFLNPLYNHGNMLRNFLRGLHESKIELNDFVSIVQELTHGSSSRRGDVWPGAAELYAALSDSERAKLRDHYFATLTTIEEQCPELKLEFPDEFALPPTKP